MYFSHIDFSDSYVIMHLLAYLWTNLYIERIDRKIKLKDDLIMESKSALTKLSIALAVLCAVICIVSIAPLVAAIIFVLVTLICLLGCLIILFVGAFVWLVTAGQTNIFGYATDIANFGMGLFNFITPIANFSFHYLTPIAGAIALFVGIVGIVISAVGISKAKKQTNQVETQDIPSATDLVSETNNGKKKLKKKKTNKGACIASLVVCCVFSAVAIIALIVAVVAVTMF